MNTYLTTYKENGLTWSGLEVQALTQIRAQEWCAVHAPELTVIGRKIACIPFDKSLKITNLEYNLN